MGGFREILVAVAGLTPQVITETLYYLTQKCDPPVAVAEIHVLTTQLGQQRILTELLTPNVGRFYAFCSEYDIRVNLDFGYSVPSTKEGHRHRNVTVRRFPDARHRGARFDQSHCR
jgi:CRISPR-associated protein (TIGR02584 family)